MSERAPRPAGSIDRATVTGIALVAYIITNVVHEGVGHGGACALVGGHDGMLNAIFFRCDAELTTGARRVLVAGGSVANLIVAALCYAGVRLTRRSPGPLHFFLWLLLALNVLMPFGYLGFSGIFGFGDWAVFVDGLSPPLLYRGLLVLVGGALYFVAAPRLIMPDLDLYLGRDPAERAKRAKQVALVPYLAGGITYVVAGFLNPESIKLVVLSAAAASFGGTSFLAWYPAGRDDMKKPSTAPLEPAGIPRRPAWWIAGGIAAALFIGVLGPGVSLHW